MSRPVSRYSQLKLKDMKQCLTIVSLMEPADKAERWLLIRMLDALCREPDPGWARISLSHDARSTGSRADVGVTRSSTRRTIGAGVVWKGSSR